MADIQLSERDMRYSRFPMEETYLGLKERWLAGERDRELALQLMYLAWMHWADPSFVTGLEYDAAHAVESKLLFLEAKNLFQQHRSKSADQSPSRNVHFTPNSRR